MQEFLTVTEVSSKLKVSVPTVRKYIKSGKLKALRLERVYRISKVDLDDFIYSSSQRPVVNIN